MNKQDRTQVAAIQEAYTQYVEMLGIQQQYRLTYRTEARKLAALGAKARGRRAQERKVASIVDAGTEVSVRVHNREEMIARMLSELAAA